MTLSNEEQQQRHSPQPPGTLANQRSSPDESVAWFHGKITRDAAEHILETNGKQQGQFLVRESTTSPGDYALSLVHDGEVVHYQIRRHGEDAFFSIDEGPIIHGLEELIAHHQKGGLVSVLSIMCRGQPPPPDTRRHGRSNLLHRATKQGDLNVVRELLKSGYHNLDAKNQDGQTAIHLACTDGNVEVLKSLIEAGASTNCQDGSGLSPLHYACQTTNGEVVHVLLYNGANPLLRSRDTGWVPLHEAASMGHLDVIKILLSFGTPSRPRSNQDELPIDLAEQGNHNECVEFFQSYRVPPTKTSRLAWFHESVDREKASFLLRDGNLPDGTFLFRRSTRKSDVSVLSMTYRSHVYHFEVQRHGKYFYIDNGPFMDSLEHLVDHYSRFEDGLPSKLSFPIKPEGPFQNDTNIDRTSSEGHWINRHDKNANLSSLDITNLISRETLDLGATIGIGEFGSVLQGTWAGPRGTEHDVAIKILRDEHINSSREGFIQEVEIMVGLNHPCVVRLLGVCLGPPLMMVQELVPLGSLLNYILCHPENITVDEDLPRWARQVADGMRYLESRRFVHRDLAARNILLDSKEQVKISDFGLSRALGVGSEYYRATTGGRWPLKWYAPESVNFATFSHASDVWSYGVSLWEMFSFGQQPYGNLTGAQVIKILEDGQRLEQPPDCPDWVYQVMLQCWSYTPEHRPTFSQLYEMFSACTGACREPILV